MEEVLDAERPLVLGQQVRRLETDLQMAIPGVFARERVELDEQGRDQVERRLHAGELAQQRHHPPVILEAVQPHPRQDVLARHQVLVERLVHVPQQCDARHNWLIR